MLTRRDFVKGSIVGAATGLLGSPVQGGGIAKQYSTLRRPGLLGDVVICPAVATRQATGGGLEAELSLLLVHGILHLLGHDHAEPDERSAMQETERRVLDGFSRP